MLKFALLIAVVAVLVGRILAALTADSHLHDLRDDTVNEIPFGLINSELSRNTVNHIVDNEINVNDSVTKYASNRLRQSLWSYMECTKIDDGYIKYDGSSSCVNLYYDAACLNEKYLSSNSEYMVTSLSGSVKVCNKARNMKIYICVAVCGLAILIWLCNKGRPNTINPVVNV